MVRRFNADCLDFSPRVNIYGFVKTCYTLFFRAQLIMVPSDCASKLYFSTVAQAVNNNFLDKFYLLVCELVCMEKN